MSAKHFLPFLLLLILFIACKKHSSDTPQAQAADYLPVKPGNYWIYETWYVDSLGRGTAGSYNGQPPLYDSVYAISDTTISDRLYHRYRKPETPGEKDYKTWTVSDSGEYIIEPGNHIQFALSDSASVFLSRSYEQSQFSDDSLVTVQYKLDGMRTQTTPAGVFNTASMAYVWTFYPFSWQMRAITTRRQSTHYAKGIGIISETLPFYVADVNYVERRLIRYHVQ